MSHATQPYRMVPDQQARVARYRVHRLIGKLFLVLALFIALPMAVGLTRSNPWLAFSLIVPAALITGIAWKGFPAFTRCPGCRKPMKSRSKQGRVIKSGPYFNETAPSRAYLVCDHCQLYAFLGEYRAGGA